MDISVSHRDGTAVWELSGDLDFEGARAVRTVARSAHPISSRVVVDLSGVPFVDSAGLAALVGLARRASDSGGSVVITGARRSVRRLLRVTEIDRRLEIQSSLDDTDPADTAGGEVTPRALQVARW